MEIGRKAKAQRAGLDSLDESQPRKPHDLVQGAQRG